MGHPKEIEVRKVDIGPFKCYWEAKDFLGETYWLFFGITFVALILGGLVPLILIGPAYAGIGICLLARARNEPMVFEHVFKGFDYFAPSLIASLIYVGGVMVLAIPFIVIMMSGVIMMGSQDALLMMIAGFLLCVAFGYWMFVVSISMMVFIFAIFLIVDKKMEGWPAVQLALQGVRKNFWGVAGASIAGQVIYIVGAMLCFFPALLAIPIIFAGHFVAYWKIYGVQASGVVEAQEVQKVY